MAILIYPYQDMRKTGNNLWYGKVKCINIIGTEDLAKLIEQACTATEADVKAVLAELANVVTYELSNGNKILLDGIGYLYVNTRSSGALTQATWTIADNLKGSKVMFTQQHTMETKSYKKAGKTYTKKLSGRTVQDNAWELKKIDYVPKKAE